VVGMERLAVPAGAQLRELRAVNTRVCLDLVLSAATRLDRDGELPARPQATRGRYYSFMPTVLKQACVDRWAARP